MKLAKLVATGGVRGGGRLDNRMYERQGNAPLSHRYVVVKTLSEMEYVRPKPQAQAK